MVINYLKIKIHKTIASLNIRDNGTIHISKRDEKSQRVPLTEGNPQRLTPECKKVFAEMFHQFAKSEDGSMSIPDMQAYIVACGAGTSSANKQRMEQIFQQHSPQLALKKDKLPLEGFYSFYLQACVDRVDFVWNDINAFHYRYDLRKESEAREEEEALLVTKSENFPGWMICSNKEYFNLLFEECLEINDPTVVSATWQLLLRSPTNPELRNDVENLENIKNDKDWDIVLPSNHLFRLVYNILIAEALTVDPESLEDENELTKRAMWRKKIFRKKWF